MEKQIRETGGGQDAVGSTVRLNWWRQKPKWTGICGEGNEIYGWGWHRFCPRVSL